MKTSFALVAAALLASLGHAAEMQTGSCAAKCPPLKSNFCSATSPSATAFTTNYANECECLKAKCANKAVQCYAKAAKCAPAALQELVGQPATKIAPVCGSNGVTYDNYFQMKVGRALDPNIQFLVGGKCPTNLAKCVTKKCPSTRAKICATEAPGKAPIFYQNKCYFDVGKCLNAKLAVSAVCPKSNPKALSEETGIKVVAELNATTATPVTTSASGSSSGSFYVGEDPMEAFGANSTSSGSMEGAITTPSNATTRAPGVKSSASSAVVSFGALAFTAMYLGH
uniref:Secreted protein n=1 Tax=Achlya hypogyna TaxID=1202772 RepID=A0A0A7CNW6_ACHHY|nr:secreted protein [Achlya hypogyna]